MDKVVRAGELPVQLCNYMDVYSKDTIRPSRTLMRATATVAEVEKYRLDPGDVVITKDSEDPTDIAVPAYVEASADDLVCGYHLAIIRPGPMVRGRYLKYWFDLPRTRAYFGSRANGATRFGLTIGAIEGCVVGLPELLEQDRVVEVLSEWDSAIELAERRLAAARGRRCGLTQVLLRVGHDRSRTDQGAWAPVRLGEVLSESTNRSTGTQDVYSVSVSRGLVNQVEHLGRSFAATDTSHYGRVMPGDIVYTRSPTGEFPLGVIKQSTVQYPVIVSPLYGVYTPKTLELGVIIAAIFESPIAVRNYLRPLVHKGAKNTIAVTNRRFLEGRLTLPMYADEQRRAAAALRASNRDIRATEHLVANFRAQKRSLLEQLLTGKLRLPPHPDTGLDADADPVPTPTPPPP